MTWIVDIIPLPAPDDLSGIPAAYTAAWERHIGPVRPAGGDREDWLEQAARLEAAMRLLPDARIRLPGRDDEDGEAWDMPHYGEATLRPYPDQTLCPSNADGYARMSEARALMGRRTRLAACTQTAVDEALRAIGGDWAAKFTARAKTAPLAYGRAGERLDLASWLDWTLVRFEDEPDAILIQERVRMRYEYRVHIIGGRPVCGAGCVEEHTPADNTGVFDPLMRADRHARPPVESRPDLACLYWAAAEDMAAHLQGVVTGHYAMDLYLGDDGRAHLIELNAGRNAGLYALDMDALLSCAAEHPEDFMPAPLPFTGDLELY